MAKHEVPTIGVRHRTSTTFLAELEAAAHDVVALVTQSTTTAPLEAAIDVLRLVEPCQHRFDAARGYLPPGLKTPGTCIACRRSVTTEELLRMMDSVTESISVARHVRRKGSKS